MTSLSNTTMLFVAPSTYLWCLGDAAQVTQWLQNNKPDQTRTFYLSFLNHSSRAFDRRDFGHQPTSKYLKGHEQQTHDKLRAFPLHVDTLIAMLAFYLANVWPNGVVKTGVVNLSKLCKPSFTTFSFDSLFHLEKT